jgi:hypothetical protein
VNEEQPGCAEATLVRLRRATFAVAATVFGAALTATVTPTAASAHPAAYPHATRATATGGSVADPATNVPPTPDYWPTCSSSGAGSQTCIDAVVAAIDNARALEGVGPMALPSGFAAMSPAVQTFVVSNLERVDRGLQPAAGMVATLNSLSADAANADADPALPNWNPIGSFSPNRWGSNWAGDLNALASDYDWMYNDGWGPTGSYNLDCTSATASGCWGHRHNILSSYGGEELVTGVASVVQTQWTSIAQIFVAGSGSYPAFTNAWSQPTPSTSTTATPSASAVTATVDSTALSVAAPATIAAGRPATVSGRLTDTTAGAPIPGATVRICQRTVVSSSTACTSVTTDGNGTAGLVVHPRIATVYWLGYDGSPVLAAAASGHAVVRVRPALSVHARRAASGRVISAHLSPARGQGVRLQRHTARGWVTVRWVRARSWMAWYRLRAGSYRVVVAGVTGSLRVVRYVRAT